MCEQFKTLTDKRNMRVSQLTVNTSLSIRSTLAIDIAGPAVSVQAVHQKYIQQLRTRNFPFKLAGAAAHFQALQARMTIRSVGQTRKLLYHLQERRRVLEQFQALTGENDMRVTFLCGGTGAAGVAQFYR